MRWFLAAAALLLAGAAARADEIAVTIPTRPGVTESFAFDAPAQPIAAAVLFPGGEGSIGVEDHGGHAVIARANNFLVRTRQMLVASGVAVIALDAPSDHSGGIDEQFRKGAEHAEDAAGAVAWLRQKIEAPVWLVGTSMGSISAANAAVRLNGKIDGLVLSSSVSAPGRRLRDGSNGVLDLDLQAITVPVLVMDDTMDECPSSPPGNAAVIANRMTKSPRTQVKLIEGGATPRSGNCAPFSYHGYFGVEDKAVAAIVGFIIKAK